MIKHGIHLVSHSKCSMFLETIVYAMIIHSKLGNLILNWPNLLRPFKTVFPPHIDVYVFAMCFYITSGTKKSD